MTIEYIIICLMISDMVFRSNISYIDKGNIIRKRKFTFKKYFETNFLSDIVYLFKKDITYYGRYSAFRFT